MENQRHPTQEGPTAASTPEEHLGQRIRQLREQWGHSQEALARLMQGLGFTWRQTTAAKTEAGNRPIRVNEAHALAEIFGVTVNDLLPYETDQAHEERMAFSLLAAAKLRIEDSVLASHNADKQRDNALDLATDAQMLLQDAGVPPTEALNRMFRHEDDNDEGGKE